MRAVVISCDAQRLKQFRRGWHTLSLEVGLDEHVARPDGNRFRGCWQSHFDVLRSSEGPTLVMEDDAVFSSGFTLDVPPSDLVFFGEHTEAYIVKDPRTVADQLGPPIPSSNVCAQLRRRLAVSRHFIDPHTVSQRVA